MATQAWYDKFS